MQILTLKETQRITGGLQGLALASGLVNCWVAGALAVNIWNRMDDQDFLKGADALTQSCIILAPLPLLALGIATLLYGVRAV